MWIQDSNKRDYKVSEINNGKLNKIADLLKINKKTGMLISYFYAHSQGLPRAKLKKAKSIGQIATLDKDWLEYITMALVARENIDLDSMPDADMVLKSFDEYADAGIPALFSELEEIGDSSYDLLIKKVLKDLV